MTFKLTTRDYLHLKNEIIFFEDIDFWRKIFLILYPSLENSTTHITIMCKRKCTPESTIPLIFNTKIDNSRLSTFTKWNHFLWFAKIDYWQKIPLILYPSLGNSTTHITVRCKRKCTPESIISLVFKTKIDFQINNLRLFTFTKWNNFLWYLA